MHYSQQTLVIITRYLLRMSPSDVLHVASQACEANTKLTLVTRREGGILGTSANVCLPVNKPKVDISASF